MPHLAKFEAMQLQSISLVNFKNYEQSDIAFDGGINCLLGDNGEGKTNVLDAIHVLSFCKSYFNAIDSHSIQFDKDFFMVQGVFKQGEVEDTIHCSVKKGRKKVFKRNKSDYDRLADHIGRYPVVMITPFDSNLILGGSDIRRRFMDSIISQFDKSYLSSLMHYNRTLEQRNAFLKSLEPRATLNLEMLDVFDDQLIASGTVIWKKRYDFINETIQPLFTELYKEISGEKEQVKLVYHSQIDDQVYESRLKGSLDKDRMTQYTNVGIHKDDLLFEIGEGYPLKKFASQGQQKSYLLALKLAYYRCLINQMEQTPILLLDDVFDKLDRHRVMALLNMVVDQEGGQVFITDTALDRVPDILKELGKPCKVFHVTTGSVNEA